MLNQDDRVVYVGSKYASELRGKIGYIIAAIEKEKNGWVVEFGGETYVMPSSKLEKYKPSGKEDDFPEIHLRRRHKPENDES